MALSFMTGKNIGHVCIQLRKQEQKKCDVVSSTFCSVRKDSSFRLMKIYYKWLC